MIRKGRVQLPEGNTAEPNTWGTHRQINQRSTRGHEEISQISTERVRLVWVLLERHNSDPYGFDLDPSPAKTHIKNYIHLT